MIIFVGIGPGDGRYALPRALQTIEECPVLAGYSKSLGYFPLPGKRIIDFSSREMGLDKGLKLLDELHRDSDICVLVSGDPGFYSLLGTIRRQYPDWEYRVIPGLSVFQVMCAKIGISWQKMEILSFHAGEDTDEGSTILDRSLERLKKNGAAILTGRVSTPRRIAEKLRGHLGGKREIWIGRDIGTEEEFLECLTLEEIAGRKTEEGLWTMILLPE